MIYQNLLPQKTDICQNESEFTQDVDLDLNGFPPNVPEEVSEEYL